MIMRRSHELVLAIYLQKRGFAFVLFEAKLAPVDWGVQVIRTNKNTVSRGAYIPFSDCIRLISWCCRPPRKARHNNVHRESKSLTRA